MYAEFRHLDGAFAGQIRIVRKEFATIGRHPSADVPFDSQRDLDVSGRHAAVFREGAHWVVRDLGSTNGTWVNGARIKGDRVLAANDVIRFGASGPQLVFSPREGEPATVPGTAVNPFGPGATPPERGKNRRTRGRTTERIRVEVRRQTAPWKRATLMIGVAAVAAIAAAFAFSWQRTRSLSAERTQLLARTDSLILRLQATTSSVAALQGALEQARQETERLRASIATGGVSSERLEALSSELTTSLDRHEAILRAVRLDVTAIARDNSDAIGMVVSEFPDGHRIAGTGFALRTRGDTGWIVTSRHLVSDSLGRHASRLGVIFNGSNQNFRAEVVRTADSADVALLAVRVRGGVPVVRGLGGTPRAGEPVAILGFPYGFDFPMGGDWRKFGISVATFAGSVRRAGPDRIEVDAYGASGSSGSPIFNAAGEVIGVVYGGDPRMSGRIVYAVPSRGVEKLLGER